MKGQRQQDDTELDDPEVGRVVDLRHRCVEALLPLQRLGVCPEVEKQKASHREGSRQRVQLAQQERASVLVKDRLRLGGFGHTDLGKIRAKAMYGMDEGTSS